MMTIKSPEQVEREFESALGADLGPYFHALYVDVAWLETKWRDFRELYGTSEARVELLNQAAWSFFGTLHNTLFEDLLLHLTRLTDKARIGKSENVSIRGLPGLFPDPSRAEIAALVDVAVAKCAFARDWRNRHIAHRDRALALDSDTTQLAFASRGSIREAIDSLTTVIVHVHERHLGGGLSLDMAGSPGDALELLAVIQDGIAARTAREDFWARGEQPPEWLLKRPAI
jgi:hypothetical protein